jgi:hypothetical protein
MKLSVLLTGLAFVSAVVGCSAAPGTASENESVTSSTSALKKAPPTGIDNPAFVSCDFDDECVAVAPPTGCCDHGLKDAVNCEEVSAWNKANACTAPQVCAHFVTIETRVPQCGSDNLCAMVYPADIACGGLVENAHACPTGWTCDYQGHSHHQPGVCVEIPADDAGTTAP